MKTIPLTQGFVALVDDADFEAVSQFSWCAHLIGRGVYVTRGVRNADGKWVTQRLHQFLLPGVSRIDHRDGDGLNNQRENLRPATYKQNIRGFRHKKVGASSKFRGVGLHKRFGKWQAFIGVDYKQIHLGFFADEVDAARAYDSAARKFFGDFASLNFP